MSSIYKGFSSSLIAVRFEYNGETFYIPPFDIVNYDVNFNDDDNKIYINIFYSEEQGFQAEYLDD